MRDSPYYSVRSGNRVAISFDLKNIQDLFINVYIYFLNNDYFHEAFGYDCVDAGEVPGYLGAKDSLNSMFLLTLGNNNLWPIHEKIHSYSENDLFDMMEFLYDCVSVPSDGHYHGYFNCGWHNYKKFEKAPAQAEYRIRVNEMLSKYKEGYELDENGYIQLLIEADFDSLVTAETPTANEIIKQKINHAVTKYRRSRAPADRLDALKNLGDILECLRPSMKEVLTKEDESDLFNLLNNFAIRHLNQKQRVNYDNYIFYSWIFYHLLAAIHASLRLIEKHEKETDKIQSN